MDVDSIEEGLAIKKALVEGTTEDEEERPNAREKIKRIKGPNGGREKTEKRRLQREQKRLREGIDKESMRGIRAANPPVSNPFGHWNPKTEAKKRARENKKERGEDEAGYVAQGRDRSKEIIAVKIERDYGLEPSATPILITAIPRGSTVQGLVDFGIVKTALIQDLVFRTLNKSSRSPKTRSPSASYVLLQD
ncbi:Protein of unknown function [Pyronema omphalodes CBS 100304]|uniref:Uncharacterized protein n=1 Tax=Pyronema omphalodes (strain CBS 100304) TaxID=1076935 RepID=U4LGF7_PYROM|nr:Protein of unknown function [Pyronema omphalodes CBS 100304]